MAFVIGTVMITALVLTMRYVVRITVSRESNQMSRLIDAMYKESK